MTLGKIEKPAMLLVAGFGDGPAMFAPLAGTDLAAEFRLVPVALPGFGGEPPIPKTNLTTLAAHVAEIAVVERARIAVGHSVASVIVSLAALRHPWPIDTVLSLEGNLTRRDGYFSATAADHASADTFFTAFYSRLTAMSQRDPIFQRYQQMITSADPIALWQLGCDAAAFSQRIVPGDLLAAVPQAWYFYNPDNCDPVSLRWLESSGLQRTILEGASHWPTIDQPDLLAQALLTALKSPEGSQLDGVTETAGNHSLGGKLNERKD